MKTEDLKEKGFSDEQITYVMAENGKDISRAKEKLELERDNYKEQLETAQEALKEFEGVDVNALKENISKLTDELSRKEQEFKQQLSDREFNDYLSKAILEAGARSDKAVKAFLDIDGLKASKNQGEDVRKAIDTVKSEQSFLFGLEEPIKNPVLPTDTGIQAGKAPDISALRAAMGLETKK